MANLFNFGLPTPGEVRSATNRRMFSQLPNYGGGALGQANMGAAAIGMSLGRLFGGTTPEEQRAQKIQSIQTQYGELQNARGIGAPQTPEEYSAWGQGLAGELLKAGEGDYARQVMSSLPQMGAQGEDPFKDFLKEERGAARASVKAIDSRAATIRGSYGKLEKLGNQAKRSPKGSTESRSAINSMIANVVRLNSPGIVSETELQTYTGGQGTTAAMLDLIKGKGINTDAWSAGIDASGNADPDALLRIGQSLILGEATPLFDQYDDAQSRATRARLSDRAQKTYFGKSKNLNALRSLVDTSASSQAGNTGLTAAEQAELKALEAEFGGR